MQAQTVAVVNYANELESELAELEIPLKCIVKSIEEGWRAHIREDEEWAPVSSSGYNAWCSILKQFRYELQTLKWGKSRHIDGVDDIYSSKKNLSIIVNTGNIDTGKVSKTPKPKNHKGTTIQDRVDLNYNLFEINDISETIPIDSYQTWILLFYIDEKNKEIRYELSLPIMRDEKVIIAWARRIIFKPFSISGKPKVKKKETPNVPIENKKIDFEIRRKNG